MNLTPATTILLTAQVATFTAATTVVVTVQMDRPPAVQVIEPVQLAPPVIVAPSPVPAPRPSPTATKSTIVHHKKVRTNVHTPHRRTHHPRPSRLQQAVARLPGYHGYEQRWVITGRYGHYGVTDPWRRIVYLAPWIPSSRFFSVVAHEWGHIRSVLAYDGDVARMKQELNAYFGGTGYDGAEKAADCIARIVGATWTHYTRCSSHSWRAAARKLMHEQPI